MAVLIATGVLVTYRGGTVSYLLFYSALLIPLLSFLYLLYVYFRFRVYQSIDSRQVVKESAVPYQFALTNEDFISYSHVSVIFCVDYSTAEGLRSGHPVCLLPGEKWTRETEIRCHYRGEYQVGIRRILVRDFLGLFEITYKISKPLELRVLPRMVTLDRFALAEETDGRMEQWKRSSRPEMPDAQTREYQSGDAIRQIHWKATARMQKLMSREMTEEPKEEISLFLTTMHYEGTEAERIEAEDKLIEAILAVAAFYQKRHTAVRVYVRQGQRGMQSMLIQDVRELDAFYQLCCGLEYAAGQKTELVLLAEQAVRTTAPGICYLFGWKEDGDTEVAADILRRAGGIPGAILVGRAAGSTWEGNIPSVQICLGEDVKERLE